MAENKNRVSQAEERTQAFFSQNYDQLSEQLRDRTVALPGTDKMVMLTHVEGWSKGKVHRAGVEHLQAGDLWLCPFPVRRMDQSLVVALDHGEIGACVRIVRASYFDSTKNSFVMMPREGDFALYLRQNLQMKSGEVGRLRFLDETDILYLVRKDQMIKGGQKISLSVEEAGNQLNKLIEGK